MGGCCTKPEDDVIEVTNVMTNNCMCKSGARGPKVNAKLDESKNIISVSGHGVLLGSCPLDGDTAYWEIIVGKNPEGLRIGLKKFAKFKDDSGGAAELTGVLGDDSSNGTNSAYPTWALVDGEYKEGDVIGVYWDQTDMPMLSFSKNGEMLPSSCGANRVRPAHDIYPAVSVKDGATCCVMFDGDHFAHPPAGSKFKAIICASSLI